MLFKGSESEEMVIEFKYQKSITKLFVLRIKFLVEVPKIWKEIEGNLERTKPYE